jgi:hypothetical protein
MTKKNPRKMNVSPEFHREIRKAAAELDKSMLEITEELAEKLKEKKKRGADFEFRF